MKFYFSGLPTGVYSIRKGEVRIFKFDNCAGDDGRGLFPGNFGSGSYDDLRFDECVDLFIRIKE